MQLLTTSEAAAYLRLKERKLYELVSERKIPSIRATGKWLFPKSELDRWLNAHLSRPAGLHPTVPPAIVGGSHDPLLEWALRESRAGLASLAEGSANGFRRLLAAEIAVAAIHFHDPGGGEGDANVAAVSSEPELHDAVLVAFARREQGLLVAPGNPLGIASLGDAVAKGARFAFRQEGAGAQQLLEALLRREAIAPARLVRASGTAPTGTDVAQSIRAGRADCGIATRTVAEAAGLPFQLIRVERFDLLLRQRDYFREPFQALLGLLRAETFRARAAELGGLDVAGSGSVRWHP